MAHKLTAKQERFVAEYLVDLNATQAAIRAGYSAKTAGQQAEQLLKKLEIHAAGEAGKAKRSQKVGVTAEYVVESLREVAERCLQRAPVLGAFGQQATDAEGNAIWKFDSKGAIGALGLLGKHVGMFTERTENVNIDLEKCSNEQLRRIAAGESLAVVLAGS